ncbi:MAG: hypothetical protein V1911_02005 [Candidatus Micrarchaeota archaeon]
MSEMMVRFEGAPEFIVNKLTELGVFKTKSEAIRAGILELGKEYHLLEYMNDLEDNMAAEKMKKISCEIKSGRRKVFSEKQMIEKHGLK